MEFPFELISDPDEKLCAQFDVIKMKNMYGKQVRGIERSTFLIDGDGQARARMAQGESRRPRRGSAGRGAGAARTCEVEIARTA